MPSEGNLITITAPSGAGKTSLIRALLEQDSNACLSVSHTTRAARPGEENGQHYHFVSPANFKQMIADQAFFEHAEVFGNFYGTAQENIQQLRQSGKDVILEIDWQGAASVKALVPEVISIYILPPSLDELAARLYKRADESEEVIEKRLAQAAEDISKHQYADFTLINDQFDRSLQQLQTVISACRSQTHYMRQNHDAQLKALTTTQDA